MNTGSQPSQYSTHQQLLVKAVLNTGGPIVELGAGYYSTPILHELALSQRRHLFTFDNNYEWIKQFEYLKGTLHSIDFVPIWEKLFIRMSFGIVFVDQAPGEAREFSIGSFRHCADVLVLHDTENLVEYGYQRVLPTFEFQYTDKTQPTWTTVCSDKIDVKEWFV